MDTTINEIYFLVKPCQAHGSRGGPRRRAADYLDQAIAQAPTGKRFLEKGKLYYERGEWKKAVSALKKAVQAAPDMALAHLLIGYCALETGDDNLARTAFSAAAKERKYQKEANAGWCFWGSKRKSGEMFSFQRFISRYGGEIAGRLTRH